MENEFLGGETVVENCHPERQSSLSNGWSIGIERRLVDDVEFLGISPTPTELTERLAGSGFRKNNILPVESTLWGVSWTVTGVVVFFFFYSRQFPNFPIKPQVQGIRSHINLSNAAILT